MKFSNLFILLVLTTIFSCIDNINLDLPEKDKRLVVEGLITNQDTSYTVKLSKTSKYSFTYANSSANPEYGATVIISDNQGNTDTLTQTAAGVYQTNPLHMKGATGRNYKIDILTQDGKHYVSNPEEMLPVPKIDSIYFERDPNDRHSAYSYKNTIYIDWQDPGNEANYYLHHFSYFWDNKWHDESQWNTIFNDNLFDGQYLKKYTASIEYDGWNFKARISRYSLSKNAYEFWNLLFQQLYPQDDGIVSTSVPLIGNIYNINDPSDYVLGYFQVSALDIKEIFIDR